MHVKALIKALQELPNQYLEVEIISPAHNPYPLARVVDGKEHKKVFLVSEKFKVQSVRDGDRE